MKELLSGRNCQKKQNSFLFEPKLNSKVNCKMSGFKFIALPFLIAFLSISCTDVSAPEELSTKQSFYFKVNAADWVLYTDADGLNPYYSYSFRVDEITSIIYDRGAVIGYIEIDNKQQPLPSVRHYQNALGNLWTETYDFEYSKGSINIYFTNSDFQKIPPATTDFRFIIMW